MTDPDRLPGLLAERRDRHQDELFELLRIPSISTDPAHEADIRRAADWLRDDLGAHGFDAELLETGGHPAVFAQRHVADDLPTVLVYGHYDVQPADPVELWDSGPFEPTIRDGAIVARGSSDDKGQVFAHVKGAQALLEADGELPVNLKFLIEGEEEIGSRNLAATIQANSEKLAADTVVVSDGAMLPGKVPTLTYGLKGLAYVELRVRTADRDLHSGAYGGGVPNAAMALAQIVARLKDTDGRITVPGFYDAVVEITEEEREQLDRVPFDETAFAEGIGVSATPGEAGRTLVERLWTRPTLDVNGIGGGFQGEGSKTVIPAEAFAKISCRLVPNQDPAVITEALVEHLTSLAPEGAQVEVIRHTSGSWALSPIDGRSVQAAAEAVRAVDGRDPVYVRTGGTIPVVADFQRLLGAEVVLVDMGLEDDRIHSPNEKFDVDLYHRGIHLSAELLRSLGRA
ncbi:MAG: dipeptidase [Trueperaceae bacterium]|nr:dipeptidase [Trueperaceae bacterium]